MEITILCKDAIPENAIRKNVIYKKQKIGQIFGYKKIEGFPNEIYCDLNKTITPEHILCGKFENDNFVII